MFPMRCFLIWLALTPLAFAGTAHLYNLENGAETDLIYHGHGKGTVTGRLPSGESISGEWVILRSAAVGWGSIYGSGISASSTTIAASGKNEGTLIMRGDNGTILDCEFVSSFRHGAGVCKDNHDVKYKLMY